MLFYSQVIVLFIYPLDELFTNREAFGAGVQWVFNIVLAIVGVYTLMLYIALFHKAVWVKKLLVVVFSLPFLRRWKGNVTKLGDDLVDSSAELSKRPWSFWLKCFGVTVWSWCSRYWVVNALLFAFAAQGDQVLAFVRQLVIWLTLIISPTPGGSGVGEYMFKAYYSDFFPVAGTALVVAFIWRLITYYSYLIGGVCILPQWLNMKRKSK